MTGWRARLGWVLVAWVTVWLAVEGNVQAAPTTFEIQVRIQELGEEGQRHLIQRRFDLAAPLFEEALELAKQLGDPVVEARLSFFSGFARVQLDHAKGLAHLERAEMLCRDRAQHMEFCEQNRTILKITWATRGVLVEPGATASKHSLERPSKGTMPFSLDDFLTLAHSEEDPQAWQRQMLEELVGSGGYDEKQGQILRQLVKISDLWAGSDSQEVDPNQLIRHFESILEVTDSDEFPWMLPGMRESVLAHIDLFHGEVEQAKEHLLKALQRAEEKRFLPQKIRILQLLAGVHWELDEVEQAREALLTAIRIEEDFESGLQVQDPMMMALDQRQHRSIEQLVQYDAWKNKSWDALARADGLKARTLRRWLRTEGDDQRLRLTGFQQVPLKSLQRDLRQLEKLAAVTTGEHRAEVLGTLERKRREFVNLLIRQQLRKTQPTDSLAAGAPVTLETLRARLLRQPGTVLLSYFATWKELLIWVVDRRRFQMIRVEIGRQELTEKIRGVVGPLDQVGLRSSDLRGAERLPVVGSDGLKELYELLIAPVRPYLDGHQQLIVVPHSALHALPFAALQHPESGRYLVEEFVLTSTPSLQSLDVLLHATPMSAGSSPLILGNPKTDLASLPGAEREAHRVASILGSDPILGRDALESLLRQRLASTNVLHVAAHGIHNERDPYFSRLELTAEPEPGADGHLDLYEILTELDVGSLDLVVLSGCRTALGDVTPGDEIVSLGRAFLYAGSPTVVSTLWSVDDEASSRLMETFYQQLRSGVSIAEALRAGQLQLINQASTRDPYFWAGYMVEGDASRTLP